MTAVSENTKLNTATIDGLDIIITRLINAPRELVYKAWTEPKHMMAWWGPEGYSCPSAEMDVRPGGKQVLVMRSPEGEDMPSHGTYVDVVPNERLDMSEDWDEDFRNMIRPMMPAGAEPGYGQKTTILFEDKDGKTLLTIRSTFETAADVEAMKTVQMVDGWNSSLNKLDTHVATMS